MLSTYNLKVLNENSSFTILVESTWNFRLYFNRMENIVWLKHSFNRVLRLRDIKSLKFLFRDYLHGYLNCYKILLIIKIENTNKIYKFVLQYSNLIPQKYFYIILYSKQRNNIEPLLFMLSILWFSFTCFLFNIGIKYFCNIQVFTF